MIARPLYDDSGSLFRLMLTVSTFPVSVAVRGVNPSANSEPANLILVETFLVGVGFGSLLASLWHSGTQ